MTFRVFGKKFQYPWLGPTMASAYGNGAWQVRRRHRSETDDVHDRGIAQESHPREQHQDNRNAQGLALALLGSQSFGHPLTIADVIAWARGAWTDNDDMGIDANESVVWLVWPECSYSVSITSEESQISRLTKNYIRDVELPPVGDVRALFSEVVGDPVHPDAINRGIELYVP